MTMSTDLQIPLLRALLALTVGSIPGKFLAPLGSWVSVRFDVGFAYNESLNVHCSVIRLLTSTSCMLNSYPLTRVFCCS